jgi:hypothetical protein
LRGTRIIQAAVHRFETEQIVAAIARRAEHGPLARLRQHVGGEAASAAARSIWAASSPDSWS